MKNKVRLEDIKIVDNTAAFYTGTYFNFSNLKRLISVLEYETEKIHKKDFICIYGQSGLDIIIYDAIAGTLKQDLWPVYITNLSEKRLKEMFNFIKTGTV